LWGRARGAGGGERTGGGAGGRNPRGPPAGGRIYACRDGWVCISASRAEEAAALGRLAGADVGLGDRADGPAAGAVARLLADLSRAEALERLARAGVPAAPCREFQELFTQPSVRHGRAVVD